MKKKAYGDQFTTSVSEGILFKQCSVSREERRMRREGERDERTEVSGTVKPSRTMVGATSAQRTIITDRGNWYVRNGEARSPRTSNPPTHKQSIRRQ